jgi:membrane-associated phospholipid phosphatase
MSQLFSTSESSRATKSPLNLVAALIIGLLTFIPVFIFDNSLFLWMNGLHSTVTDPLWLALTTLGDGLLLGIILGAFLLVNPRVTVMGLLVMILSSAVVHFVKAAYPHLRPVEVFQTVHVVGPLLRFGSFPSGHAAAAMSAGLAIAHYSSSRVVAALAMAIAILIGLSRIFVGAHFPADVVGGVICALSVFLIVMITVWPALEKQVASYPSLSRMRFRVAFAAEILAIFCVLFVHSPYNAKFMHWLSRGRAAPLQASSSAEFPSFAVLVVFVVLVFVAVKYRRLKAAER